jgi:hypothetical protein
MSHKLTAFDIQTTATTRNHSPLSHGNKFFCGPRKKKKVRDEITKSRSFPPKMGIVSLTIATARALTQMRKKEKKKKEGTKQT